MSATYTALFPFCGLGAGALGFLRANATLFGVEHGFRSLGGIDLDADACRDFEALTGTPALCADVSTLRLAGKSSGEHRKRIGNAVPVPAARAIATQMLLSLLSGEAQGFSLSSGGSVWVRERELSAPIVH